MRDITLVMAYYENGGMLKLQYDHLRALPNHIKQHLTLVLVDDGSPTAPAWLDDTTGVATKLLRIHEDIRWNQDGARNIGVKEATAEWVLLTDMDHVVPVQTWQTAMSSYLKPNAVYRFTRLLAPEMVYYKEHPNSWLMTKTLFDWCGGYDERFRGWYGTDGDFRNRFQEKGASFCVLNQPLVVYGRDLVPDASTTRYERKTDADRDAIRRIKVERGTQYKTLRYLSKYTRVLP